MTTEAPGYPPALIPRMTMRSTDARRADDMPTDFGVLTGNPSDTASATYAPRRIRTTDAPSYDFVGNGLREQSPPVNDKERDARVGRTRASPHRRFTTHILATPPGSSVYDATYTVYCYSWCLFCQDERRLFGSQCRGQFCDPDHKWFSSFRLHG